MKHSAVTRTLGLGLVLSIILTGCDQTRVKIPASDGHIDLKERNAALSQIPKPVIAPPPLPAPEQIIAPSRHTVVVNDVPVKDLLFSLARDTNLNLDIDNNIGSTPVTLNAVNQPLPALLSRIAKASRLRIERKGNVLRVQADKPYLQTYRVDYLNISRSLTGVVNVSTEIDSTGGKGIGGSSSSGGGSGNNSSQTAVKNSATNDFWNTLTANIANILDAGTSKATSSKEGHPDIVLNRESGILAVRAKASQHKDIQRFINEVVTSSQRQVLIEATIAEVTLSDRYQAGIDWSIIDDSADSRTNVTQQLADFSLFARPTTSLTLSNAKFGANAIQTTIRALETFGDVKIMSSPKVMALNNQTALLKVVDNLVYFTIDVDIQRGTGSNPEDNAVYESNVNTVPVGFVMGVTPYINEHGNVTLNVRPTISRVIGQAEDPNPALAQVNISNKVPVIQVREVESILKVASGEVAVIGGLMQDDVSKDTRGVPLLSSLPMVGELFSYKDENRQKTELVIFIRPRVIDHTKTGNELKEFERYLPTHQEDQ